MWIEKKIKVLDDCELKTAFETHFLSEGEVKIVRFKSKKIFEEYLKLGHFVEASPNEKESKFIPTILPSDGQTMLEKEPKFLNPMEETPVEEPKFLDPVEEAAKGETSEDSDILIEEQDQSKPLLEPTPLSEETLEDPVSEESERGITSSQSKEVVESEDTVDSAEDVELEVVESTPPPIEEHGEATIKIPKDK